MSKKIYIENGQSIPSVIIQDSVDPAPSGFTEATTIANFFLYGTEYGLTESETLDEIVALITDWTTHDPAEKAQVLAYIEKNHFVASITTDIRNDVSSPYNGFKIFNITSVQTEWWNGSTWTTTGGGDSRNNHVLVKSKADLPTPSGGVITLNDNCTYELNGAISLGTDHILAGVSNIIYGIDKSNDGIIYTGTGGAIRSVDQDLSLKTFFVSANVAGGKAFDLVGSVGLTKRLEVAELILNGCDTASTISGGFATVVIRGNLMINCADGISVTGSHNDVFITDNILESFTGTATIFTFGSGTYHTLMISRNMFNVSGTQTALNVSNSLVFTEGGGIIEGNIFEGAGEKLTGINALQSGWEILAGANIGLTGLMVLNIPLAVAESSTTSKYSTYSSSGQSTFIDLPNNLNLGADTIQANLEVEARISDGSSWWCDLYNFTDGNFIDAPTYPFEFNFNASGSNVNEKGQSGFQILPTAVHGKSLGAVMCGQSGGGSRTTTLLNAILQLKIYKA